MSNAADANNDPDSTETIATSSAIIHLRYDVFDPPAVPSPQWTRFICISDTHAHCFPVPDGDVLLHGGDLTESGRLSEFRTTVEWLRDLPHRTKILIAGNHDLSLDDHDNWYDMHCRRWHFIKEDTDAIRELLIGEESKEAGLVYLENEEHHFQTRPAGKTWSVYGSPWSPYFYNWGFNYHRGEDADRLTSKFPRTDILLTHGPPAGVLDRTVSGESVGCESLEARLSTLRPRLHVFGHIHEDHGGVIRQWDSHMEDQPAQNSEHSSITVAVNASNSAVGPKARLAGPPGDRCGKGPFQPIIIDLLDDV